MSLVTVETRKVYRVGRRLYAHPKAAYLRAAKIMFGACYPRHPQYSGHSDEPWCPDGMSPDEDFIRSTARRARLYGADVEGADGFDMDRYWTVIKRLARFLRYVDERRNRITESAPPDATLNPPAGAPRP
jgi:hypothetical protein